MLMLEPTPNHAGIVLWGDSWTLTQIIDFVRKVTDANPVIPDEETFLLGLSYDVRKAAGGYRLHKVHHQPLPAGNINIFGVEILWPVMLAQLGLLRRAMAYMMPSREDQSIMFALEAALEAALQAVTPANAYALMEQMTVVGAHPHAHLSNLLDSRCRYFIEQTPSMRISVLPALLASLDPMYSLFAQAHTESYGSGMIPADVWAHFEDDESDWPAFEW